MSISNPKQIGATVRKKTFTIKNELSVSSCDDGSREYPLEFYSGFSRFPIAIINEDKKVVTGNVKVTDMSDIIVRSKFAYEKDMQMSISVNNNQDKSLAYTVLMTSGKLKGKTPAQVLAENPEENKQLLNQQYKWLKDNIDKNPNYRAANQKQMDAIVEASKLFNEGKLSSSAAINNRFAIYEPGMRPLTRKTNPDGTCFVYEVSIYWIFGSKYPVEVNIRNFYAPVTRNEKGLLNVQAKKKVNEIFSTMNLSAAEWQHHIHMIETNMRTFEDLHAQELYSKAEKASQKNRQNYTQARQG